MDKQKFRFLIFLFLILFPLKSISQTYGNEWIDYTQEYYRISARGTGIYKLDYSSLTNVGVPLASIDPRNLQIWHRGEQLSIRVVGEGDGVFDLVDYVEFYGKRNDGLLDSSLYIDPDYHLNPYYNIFSDTSAYFLTWGSAGNRVTEINLTSASAPLIYHIDEQVKTYANEYVNGYILDGTSSYDSRWDRGEGWCSTTFHYAPSSGGKVDFNYTFSTPNPYLSGGTMELELKLTGRNGNYHLPRLSVGTGASAQSYTLDSYSKYTSIDSVFATLDENLISSDQLQIKVEALADGVNNDFQSVVYFKLRYKQLTDMQSASEKYFTIPAIGNDTSVLNIDNPVSNAHVWDITTPSDVRFITGTVTSSLNIVVPGTDQERKLYVYGAGNELTPPKITPVTFTNDTASVFNYLIISHSSLDSGATLYKDYRESVAGGNYTVKICDVERLYDQYNYGEKSPIAIRRFIEHIQPYVEPEYIFIIGKGITADLKTGSRPYYRHVNDSYDMKDLIPTFGSPGSDIAFTSYLDGSGYEPKIPIGRLSANTNVDVANYRDKIMVHETVGVDALWRKRLVHLSGGKSGEADLFLAYVNGFKAIAEGPLLGGKVTTFSKSSSSEIEFFNIAELVNNGLQVITFFGHSSTIRADIDIGFASRIENGYTNKGKYPLLISNGCGSGNMFVSGSLGEDWMNADERGAIHVLAHSDLGYATEFKNWTEQFYKTAYTDTNFFGQTIGQLHKETIRRFHLIMGGNRAHVHKQQMNLQGDPATSLFPTNKPDLFIDDSRVSIKSFNSSPVTAVTDSFYIQIIVSNFGMAPTDSFTVCIDRTYNNGQTSIQYGPLKFPAVLYQDTLSFVIASKDPATYGQNVFNITVDCLDSLNEISEINNSATLSYFMPLSGVKALFPPEFSIVGSDTVSFIAQSTDLLIDENTEYIFQLDTNDLFETPLIELEAISGSLVSWNDLVLPNATDSLVYYWRVRLKNLAVGEDTLWDLSSLTYIPDQEGWSQSHFQQYRKDPVAGIGKDFDNFEWVFDSTSSNIAWTTGGHGVNHQVSVFSVNGQALFEWGNSNNNCVKDGILMLAFDRSSVLPYHPDGFEQGDCGNKPRITSEHTNLISAANLTKLYNYLGGLNIGDHVLFMSIGNNAYSSWSSALKDTLAAYGADSLDFLTNGAPYMFLGRKGVPDSDIEMVGLTQNDIISGSHLLSGQQVYSTITSTLIGPASTWGTYYHKFEREAGDLFAVDIIGVGLDESETLLTTLSNVTYDSLDLASLAASYPYVKLRATVSDSTNLDAPQLKKWLVVYSGVPEGTINPALIGLDQYNIPNKAEGDSINLCFAFQNISDKNFDDSLIVRYTLTNTNSGAIVIVNDTLTSLIAGDTLIFCYSVATENFVGENTIHVFVNPKIAPEQYYDNNVLVLNYVVEEDNVHPVLDVVFDGQHILDGEIVSPNPFITITMHDENDFYFKTDTVGIDIFLKRPCTNPDPLTGCPFEKIELNDPSVAGWYPAGPDTDFKVEYNPQGLEDGMYMLMAQVQDASGNKSGIEPYKINFQVINEASVTHVLPYPNPFSSSTRFVFTLTGSEVPDQMKIQIMTVSGRVVRTITQDEIGPLRIGNNITEYAWDGTDEYGDQLANGTYLYSVDMRTNGDGIKHRETKADQGFKKNFGKIVIIR